MKKISEKLIKALKILSKYHYPDGLTARDFAQEMWEDSPAWKRSYNTGNGATRGKGMWLCAGSYLSKLRYKGLIYVDYDRGYSLYTLSNKGRGLLKK